MKKFILYLIRWQLSTPILAPVIAWFSGSPNWLGTPESWIGSAVANLIGGSIFFWVDRFIFTSAAVEMWHFIPEGICDGCGKITSLWRLTLAPGYDKRDDDSPKYLCMMCSKFKTDELRTKGIKIRGKSK
jgi:hypothetical protein